MRSADAIVASLFIVCGLALGACARESASRAALAGWESRYPSSPQCVPTTRLGAARATDGARTGTLVVRLVPFGASALVDHSAIALSPLAPLDSATQPSVRREDDDDHPEPFVATVAPGRYLLASRAFGYEARVDTIAVRPGATDTVTIALEEYADALRNRHNCRPRGFRRAGERACVTEQITTVLVLDRVRDMTSPRFRYGLGFPAGDSTDVHIVDDERLCERAAALYGLGKGPPRRVVLVQAGNVYVVYDPAEPVALGELNQWLVLDKRWRVLARLAL